MTPRWWRAGFTVRKYVVLMARMHDGGDRAVPHHYERETMMVSLFPRDRHRICTP